jgi:diguanylate cyclase (GGDEF)-like protein/PAS domain S-box-containing protein
MTAARLKWLRKLIGAVSGAAPAPPPKIDYQVLMENSTDVVIQLGLDRCISFVSPSVLAVLGWQPEEMLAKQLNIIHEDDVHLILEARERLDDQGVQSDKQVFRIWRKDGQLLWVEANARRIRDPITGELGDTVLMMRDITTQKLLEQKLEAQALTDGLTGLANRRCFDETLDREWRRTQRDDTHLSLLLLDLDHFKSLNDEYGHQVGDDCLRAVAAAVKAAARRPGDLSARYGGEEIAIILPNTDAQGAFEVAETIRKAVEALRLPNAGNLEGGGWVTASIGAATAFSRVGASFKMPEGILVSADSALYKAKNSGRNCVAATLLLMAKQAAEAPRLAS